ncbi:MAG: hypothetical protein J5755_01040, partial [Clostridia bacterium]|nr:hypothetical protein [Clostridia bacterium]
MDEQELQVTDSAIEQEPPRQPEPNEEQAEGKKKRSKKPPLTPEQKRTKRLRGLLIAGIVLGCIAVVIGVLAIVNAVGQKGLLTMAQSFDKVDYQGAQLVP